MDAGAVSVIDITPFRNGSGREDIVAAVAEANAPLDFWSLLAMACPSPPVNLYASRRLNSLRSRAPRNAAIRPKNLLGKS